jgi:hypothetical protein
MADHLKSAKYEWVYSRVGVEHDGRKSLEMVVVRMVYVILMLVVIRMASK